MVVSDGATPERPTPLASDVPSATRMYDYYLGGHDNFESDRRAVEQLLTTHPQAVEVVRNNRGFLNRAVSHVAESGVDQFIDVGAGIPTSPHVHELARASRPGARVVYVDNDPVVLAHDRALLAADTGIGVVDADMHDAGAVLTDPETRRLVDLDRPVALIFIAVLEFSPDPHAVVSAFRDALPAGSYLIASHLSTEGIDERDVSAVKDAYRTTPSGIEMRSREQIEALFDGFELVAPGLVDVAQWRGFGRQTHGQFTGAVGRLDRAGRSQP